MKEIEQISYLRELQRKGIHLTSLLIPIVYSNIDKTLALYILAPLFAVSGLGDILRHISPSFRNFVHTYFARMMRPHELNSDKIIFNGATYVLLSALLCVILFPKIIAVTAFSILIISDIASALIGRKFGTIPFFDKSLQGSIAFFISALVVLAVIGSLTSVGIEFYYIGAVAAAFGAVIEAASTTLKMDDNFSIPMSIGFSLWGLLLLLPTSTQVAILKVL